MRRPKAGQIWTAKRDALAWPRVRVLDVLGEFVSYAESYPGGAESVNPAAGFVDDFVTRYAPPPLELPNAQAILPLTAGGFRAATFNGMAWPDDAVIALVKVTVVDNIVSVEVEEPE